MRTGKSRKMREQGGGEGENDGVREGKARKHGGEQGRKKICLLASESFTRQIKLC